MTETVKKIPLVDLKAQYRDIGSDIDAAIRRVVENTAFIMGPDVAAFEVAFAEFAGASHCVGVASGTAALELALRALNIGPGHEVITAAHTFIATAEAISAVGATPVFVDIDPLIYTIDPVAVEAAITPATRAIIPVHIYGHPAEMDDINAVAERFDLAVIEDAAQAHGATYHGRKAGNLAHLACFSFYPGKNLGAYGDAGAVTTADGAMAEQIRLWRNHGRRSKYVHDQIGLGERIDTLQAAILGAKLPYLARWTDARRRLAARYTELLAGCELILPTVAPGVEPAWHLYVIRTPVRDDLLAYLQAQGIGAGIHYPVPLHRQPAYSELGYGDDSLPVTEEIAATCLSLPLYPEMSDADQDRVVAAVYQFLGQENQA